MDWEEALMRGIDVVMPLWLFSGGILGILIAGSAMVFRRPPAVPKPRNHQRETKEE